MARTPFPIRECNWLGGPVDVKNPNLAARIEVPQLTSATPFAIQDKTLAGGKIHLAYRGFVAAIRTDLNAEIRIPPPAFIPLAILSLDKHPINRQTGAAARMDIQPIDVRGSNRIVTGFPTRGANAVFYFRQAGYTVPFGPTRPGLEN